MEFIRFAGRLIRSEYVESLAAESNGNVGDTWTIKLCTLSGSVFIEEIRGTLQKGGYPGATNAEIRIAEILRHLKEPEPPTQ